MSYTFSIITARHDTTQHEGRAGAARRGWRARLRARTTTTSAGARRRPGGALARRRQRGDAHARLLARGQDAHHVGARRRHRRVLDDAADHLRRETSVGELRDEYRCEGVEVVALVGSDAASPARHDARCRVPDTIFSRESPAGMRTR